MESKETISFSAHPAKGIHKISRDKAQVLGIQSYGGLSVNPRKGAWCCSSPSLAHTASIIMGCKRTVVIVDFSPPGVHGNFQARILEWVVISSSRGSSQPRNWTFHLLLIQVDSLPLSYQGIVQKQMLKAILLFAIFLSTKALRFANQISFG